MLCAALTCGMVRKANITGENQLDEAKPVDQFWYDVEPNSVEVRPAVLLTHQQVLRT